MLHVLQSTNRVTAIRGGAGTGKTTMMREAVAAIESTGQKFLCSHRQRKPRAACCGQMPGLPTRKRSRHRHKTQNCKRGSRQAIRIDEAVFLSVRTLARGSSRAKTENCRAHSFRRHCTASRRRAWRCPPAFGTTCLICKPRMTEIRRQKANAHNAVVADLRGGDSENAFNR